MPSLVLGDNRTDSRTPLIAVRPTKEPSFQIY